MVFVVYLQHIDSVILCCENFDDYELLLHPRHSATWAIHDDVCYVYFRCYGRTAHPHGRTTTEWHTLLVASIWMSYAPQTLHSFSHRWFACVFVLFSRTASCSNNITNCPNKGYRTSTYIAQHLMKSRPSLFNNNNTQYVSRAQRLLSGVGGVEEPSEEVDAKEKGTHHSNWKRSSWGGKTMQSPSCGLPKNSQIVKPQITTHMYTAAHRWCRCRTRNGQRMLSTRRNECAAPTFFWATAVDCQWNAKRLRSSRKKNRF